VYAAHCPYKRVCGLRVRVYMWLPCSVGELFDMYSQPRFLVYAICVGAVMIILFMVIRSFNKLSRSSPIGECKTS